MHAEDIPCEGRQLDASPEYVYGIQLRHVVRVNADCLDSSGALIAMIHAYSTRLPILSSPQSALDRDADISHDAYAGIRK